MDDDVSVRKLVELIFLEKKYIPEMTAANSSIPACLLRRDFCSSMKAVLSTKQTILIARWGEFIDTCYSKMFDSPEMYLRHILFACNVEHESNQNIFDSFINVCAVLINVTGETLVKTKMDFRHLNPDIFMVFYQNTMKEIFRKHGGFQGLVEFIRGHRYIALSTRDDKLDHLSKEMIDDRVFELRVNFDDIANDDTSAFMAQKVLSTTSVGFATLLSKPELVQNLVAYKRGEKTKKDEITKAIKASLQIVPLDKICDRACKLNPDSKTNRVAEHKDTGKSSKLKSKQKEDIAELEDIIEKVVRNNLSKSSGQEKVNIKKLKSGQKEDIAELEVIMEKVVIIDLSKSSGQEKANIKKLKSKQKEDIGAELEEIIEKVVRNNLSKIPGQEKANIKKLKSEQKEDIAEYKDIIEKVTRYNHSKSSGHEKANNSIQKEACGILEHLNYNIESLIGVLDKYDKE